MYTKYRYNVGATFSEILDDVYLIIGGETNKANLSASCDQSLTEIISAVASPWIKYDDVSATQKVLRLEIADDSGVFKYVTLNDVSGIYIRLSAAESWDAGLDTGTKETPLIDKISMGTLVASGGTLHIAARQTFFIIMHEGSTGILGDAAGDPSYGSIGCFECTRDAPNLNIAGGMPNWFVGSTALLWGDSDGTQFQYFYEGRDDTDTVLVPFKADMSYTARDNAQSDTNSYSLTGLGGATALKNIGDPTQFFAHSISIGGNPQNAQFDANTHMGDMSARCDIWFLAPSTNDVLDRVLINEVAYILFKTGYTTATAGTEFGGKLAIPYG